MALLVHLQSKPADFVVTAHFLKFPRCYFEDVNQHDQIGKDLSDLLKMLPTSKENDHTPGAVNISFQNIL